MISDAPTIPPLVPHCRNWLCRAFRLKCPDCDTTFTNGHMQTLGFPLHYASAHLGISPFRWPGQAA